MVCEQSTSDATRLLPWLTRVKLFLVSILLYFVCRRDGTLNRFLLSFVQLKVGSNPSPSQKVRTGDFTVDPVRGVGFRLFLPGNLAAGQRLPLMVFFHGGAFAFLSAAFREYDAIGRSFCEKLGVAVVSVNYRLAPEHRFPAQYDDGVDVLRFLECAKATSLCGEGLLGDFFRTVDLSQCFLAGDSAGANIAHHVAQRWTASRSLHISLAGLIAIQPFFGGEGRVLSEQRLADGPLVTTERTDWMWKAFLPRGASRDHPAASAVAAAENLSDRFPPVMVVAGDSDPLLDWQRKYYRSLLQNGKEARLIEYSGAIHAFFLFPEIKGGSSMLLRDIRSFIRLQTLRRQQLKVNVGSRVASSN